MTLKALVRLGHRRRRRAGNPALVNIHIRDLAQLFNSLDPSPFWDRVQGPRERHASAGLMP